MEKTDQYVRDLATIAPALESLVRLKHAEPVFDVFSGSLIWTDEIPLGLELPLDCLRLVLRFRTGLIIGVAEPGLETFWKEAMSRFPRWIGFSKDRVSFSPALRDFYEVKRREALAEDAA